jgi:putative endonuclease
MEKRYWVYIMSNIHDTVLYIGVTNNLVRRVIEHREHKTDGFSSKYKTVKLVYYESTTCIESAIEREKQIKKWSRAKKNDLVNGSNPKRKDLFPMIKDEII